MTLTTTEELKHLASSDNANELTRRLARECLANREAQPVMWAHERKLSTDVAITKDATVAATWESEGLSVKPLYTAPPAPAVPAVPDAMPRQYLNGWPLDYSEYANGWNACRAAMLAQPVSGGYKLPGGWIACSDRMPDADGAYWCWFGKEKPSVIQQRVCIWNDRNHEWCDSSVTHWMPLPAAPTKGEKQ
ncbi:DUF551 domain-containing protein [Serratia bockelmannii]|uniref:DUF551 domain-containing protein n=1 Tax=Serratia bockelmannii TaxID=2703793 RepID=UPI00313B410A